MDNNGMLLSGAVLAGVSVVGPAGAITETNGGSFVLSFVTPAISSTTLDLAPFSGTADQLESVTLNLQSRYFITDAGTEEGLLVRLAGDFNFIGVDVSLGFGGPTEFSFQRELLGAGFDASLFVGGPVTLELDAFDDEGSVTGIWYAGVGVPFLGLEEFGGVTITYQASPIPLPAGLPLLASSAITLGALTARGRRAVT